MIWALDMDVFDPALCPSVSSPYPLLSAATAVLRDSSQPGTPGVDAAVALTTQAPWVGSTAGPTSSEPSADSHVGTGSEFGAQVGSGAQREDGETGLKTGSQAGSEGM